MEKRRCPMNEAMIGVYGIVIMFAVLFLLRIPAGFTMAIVGFLGIAYVTSIPAACGMIGTELWNILANYGLTVIPMFILVGEFIYYAGYNDSLYHATNCWFAITGRACRLPSWLRRPFPPSAVPTRLPPPP
jgi:TRAP-type mannitol/chloroaromatic compound transport system permease large subunit